MTTKFESIFASSTDVDPDLNKIFTRKVAKKGPKKNIEIPDMEEMIEDDEEMKPTRPKKLSPETEKRTIFVGNLNTDCKKEELVKIFKSYGKIEAVRFRNIVPEDITKPKKYAYITKQLHPSKQSINGFIRFKDEESAVNAAKEINGMEYKNRHLRVDVATGSKVHDNKTSVFLGALAFDVTDEAVHAHFEKCGDIDNVRIIRDNKTGVGKGFGYVQFKTVDSVTLALKLDATKMGERKIRVSRAVKKLKEKKTDPKGRGATGKENKVDNDKNKKGSNNKFQSFSDKSAKDQGLSRLGKVKHQKRKDEQAAGVVKEATGGSGDAKSSGKKSFNIKDVRVTKRKRNEIQRKIIKKKHVGTNNKQARRFNI